MKEVSLNCKRWCTNLLFLFSAVMIGQISFLIMNDQANFILKENNKTFHYHFKWYLTSKLSLLLILLSLGLSTFLDAQPIVTRDPFPYFEIEGRARNGNTDFEGALFTPATPAPGQPGGAEWQMNPAGSPVWNSNGNLYGDIHSFHFSFNMATGMSVWRIDFNRDGDYKDNRESITNIAPSLVGKAFKYINLCVQGNASLISYCTNFTINGFNMGYYSSHGNTAANILFKETSGHFADIEVTGNFSFSGNGGSECPRLKIRLGGIVNESPMCSVTSPSNSSQFDVNDTIHIVADAKDSDGTISKVQFYSGSVKIGEDLKSPYTVDLPALSSGPIIITAKAFDNKNASTLSSPVTVFVEAPISCIITEPLDNSVFRDPGIITINALVSGQNIKVTDFYVDGIWIAADSIQPFSAGFINPSLGNHIITAIAKNNYGNVASSTSVNITIKCIPEDFNNSSIVDINDFSMFNSSFGKYCTCDEDLDRNGYVDIADFSVFINKFGCSCH